jgi:hypothetical protein
MAVWKQLILGLLVLVIGAALWIGLVPGSRESLAKLGLDVPAWAAVEPQQKPAEGGPRTAPPPLLRRPPPAPRSMTG